MTTQTIGSALVARRQKLGIDKGQAADKIGMSRTTYSSYEQDKQRPSVDVFPALAHFLEVSIEDFLLLYGATAIVAVRPALESVLLAQSGLSRASDTTAATFGTNGESNPIALPESTSHTADEFEANVTDRLPETDDVFETDATDRLPETDDEFETDAPAAPLAVQVSQKKTKDKKKKKHGKK